MSIWVLASQSILAPNWKPDTSKYSPTDTVADAQLQERREGAGFSLCNLLTRTSKWKEILDESSKAAGPHFKPRVTCWEGSGTIYGLYFERRKCGWTTKYFNAIRRKSCKKQSNPTCATRNLFFFNGGTDPALASDIQCWASILNIPY